MQARSKLYGRRIRGDLGPLNTDPATNLPSRILAPAVSLTGVDQRYDQESAIPNFELGSRMVVDERVYHYSKAGAALVHPCTYRIAVAADQILAVNDLLSVAPAAVIGDYTVVVTVGAFQGGVVVADEFKNGFVEIWPVAGGSFMWRRIVSNTATAVGGDITITVDRPFNVAVGVASQVTIHPSIYRNVQDAWTAGLPGFATPVGVAPIPVTLNYYFWLQTYGRCFVGPTGAWPGSAADYRDVYFHSGGEINSSLGEGIGVAQSPNRVGYALGSGNYGTAEIMLQLAP